MAAALLRWKSSGRLYVRSCGAHEGAKLDGFAVAVMKEIGVDISDHEPITFEELDEGGFDVVITLAPVAHHRALELTRTDSIDVEYWPTMDATYITGSREQKLEAYRLVRDELDTKIKERFSQWVTA